MYIKPKRPTIKIYIIVIFTNLRETIRGSKSFGVVGLDPRTYSTILTPKPPVSLQKKKYIVSDIAIGIT